MSLQVQVFGPKGSAGTVEFVLPDFSKETAETSVAVAVRAITFNSHQRTSACKSRGMVNYTNKKPWRQKGTGRARVSSARSPIWRGGGVTFGPQPGRRFRKALHNVKKIALWYTLSQLVEQQRLLCWQWNAEKYSTAVFTKALADVLRQYRNGEFLGKTVTLLVSDQNFNVILSARNVASVNVELYGQVDVVALAKSSLVITLKDEWDMFAATLGESDVE